MSTGDQNVAKLHRTTGTLLAVVIVPLSYFVGAAQSEAASFLTIVSLAVGGYFGCLLVSFAFVKIFGGWLPDNG